MPEPMTLEEALRVIDSVNPIHEDAWGRAIIVLRDHARATLAAPRGEPECVTFVRRTLASQNVTNENDALISINGRDVLNLLNAYETLRAELARVTAERDKLREFARDIRDNWDCDNDSHRYNTRCRACEAKKILNPGAPRDGE